MELSQTALYIYLFQLPELLSLDPFEPHFVFKYVNARLMVIFCQFIYQAGGIQTPITPQYMCWIPAVEKIEG